MTDFNKAIQKYALDCGISIKEATEDAERTIQNTMLIEKVNRNFAESSWIEDVLDTDVSAMKKMEQKAKENKTAKPQARAVSAYGQTRTRTHVQNDEKRAIMAQINNILTQTDAISAQNVCVVNLEREISFTIGANEYSIVLTQHRKAKKA